jgi:hypothetical protein
MSDRPSKDPEEWAAEVASIGARRRAAQAEAAATRVENQRRALAEQMLRELEEIERRLDARAPAPRIALGQINLRRKPRFSVEASVLLDHEGRLATMQLVNVSLTGALVAMKPLPFAPPRVGALLFITLFATNEPTLQVDVNARVVRHDDRGLALDWSDNYQTTHAVAVLLDRLSG